LTGGEQRLVGLTLAFFEPLPDDRDGLGCQGGGAVLATLSQDPDVSAGAEPHIADLSRDEFGDAHAGLQCQEQERAVAAAEPGPAVRGGEERLGVRSDGVADGRSRDQ
jgi:hypothetical protein